MGRVRLAAVGLVAVAWVSVGVSLVAVFFTPRRYCDELPAPSGWVVTTRGLLVAVAALVLAAAALAVDKSPLPRFVVVVAVVGLTFAAGLTVFVFAASHTDSSMCG